MGRDQRPPDAVAFRHYVVPVNDAGRASLTFTLGRPEARTLAADYARMVNALAHGVVSLGGYPGRPRYSAVWVKTAGGVDITSASEHADRLNRVIAPYLREFLADVAAADAVAGRRDEPEGSVVLGLNKLAERAAAEWCLIYWAGFSGLWRTRPRAR